MNIFEITILNITFISFPLVSYLLFVMARKNTNQEVLPLLFDLALLSSMYLVLRTGSQEWSHISILLINVPLIIAYVKKRYEATLIVSLVILTACSIYYPQYWYIFVLEYILYFVIHYFLEKRGIGERFFIFWFLIIKTIFYTILISDNNIYTIMYQHKLLKEIFIVAIFYIITTFVLWLFTYGESIIEYHLSLKELEKDKQIRNTLFKITHEVKNPIAVCKGYLDMFDVNNLEHARKYVPILKEEIARTLVLLQDFLSMTKIKLDKDILDIGMLIEDVVENFKPIMKSKKIKLTMNLSDDEIYIDGDYNRLTQVMINVIKNSIEAMDKKKSGKLMINLEDDIDNIIITVEDNGEGISEENLEKIKEPFFTTKRYGTGLGVSLSREIIGLHNGKIVYESVVDKGTKVAITLPKLKENKKY